MSNARTLANTINSSSQIVVPSGGIAFTDLDSSNDAATANEAYVMGQNGYEEGTWTPILPNGGTLILANESALYTKIGRQVAVTCYVTNLAPTNNGSAFVIGGLPFTILSPYYTGGSLGYAGDSNISSWLVIGLVGTTTIGFRVNNGSSAARTNANYLTAASGSEDSMIITLTYFV